MADGVGKILTMDFFQLRFVVEEIDMGRPAGLEKVDDTFRLGREMGGRGGTAADKGFRIGGEQGAGGHHADAEAGEAEETAAGEGVAVWFDGVHLVDWFLFFTAEQRRSRRGAELE